MKDRIIVSAAPHLHDRTNIPMVMWNVVIALVPALVAAVWFWGWKSLWLTLLGAFSAVAAEALVQKFRKLPVSVADGSAFLTGMLLSYNISVGVPFWLPMVGSVFAIIIGKQVFGGLGNNPVNPALLGRAFLLASWPTLMTDKWVPALNRAVKDGHYALSGMNDLSLIAADSLQTAFPKVHTLLTSATPLKVAQTLRDTTWISSLSPDQVANKAVSLSVFENLFDLTTLKSLFAGNIGGCIGEVSVFALLLGAAWLIYKNIIDWRVPSFYIGTVFVIAFLFGGIPGSSYSLGLPFFHIFSGGLMLGAFFMATDYTTTPLTKKGRIIFGIGCGLLTMVIRLVGGYPEGVSYSILFMNVMTPLIDRLTMPRAFGEARK